MTTLWDSVESVFVIFLLIGAGVLVAGLGWVSRDTAKIFSKIVIRLAVPGTLVYNLTEYFTRQQLLAAWLPLLLVFIIIPGSFFVGKFFARVLRIPQGRCGLFAVMFSLSNTVFIGFPVAQALFGAAGMPYAVFCYLGNTTTFWTLGYLAIRKDADVLSGKKSRVSPGEVVRKLMTPPILTFVTVIILILANIELPGFIRDTAKHLGNLTTPLSLIFTGCMIYFIGFKGLRLEKGMLPVLFGRFMIIPALGFGISMLAFAIAPEAMGQDFVLMRNVFTVQIGLPVMMQTTIVAELYGADAAYATKNVLLTTLASLVAIPLYVVVLALV